MKAVLGVALLWGLQGIALAEGVIVHSQTGGNFFGFLLA